MLICIDAGHCLSTPGKRCLKSIDLNETREWVLNSRVANKLEAILAGYSCRTMRVDDVTGRRDVTLSQRVAAAHIVEFKGRDIGQDADRPLRTITASAGEFADCRAELMEAGSQDLMHWPEVRDLLNRHCGYEMADDEILLLEIGGGLYFIADILLRMLTPRELYNAMGFPPDYIIDRDYLGNEYGKTKQVARCGNAVCPPMAMALVRANLPEWCSRTITTMEELEKAVTA